MKCKIYGKEFQPEIFLNKNGADIFNCPSCKVFFVHPVPSVKELRKIYSFENNYFKHTGVNYTKGSNSEFFKWYKENNAGRNFLDVGCGNGQMLFSATEKGFRATGIDLNADMIKILKQKNSMFLIPL
ncbi:MAG: methyltransferase domain-containing protein [Nanoarchaeota archaeon]|nr:methyltransferase domain-containing protein [Nanoarchaeota archaeon]